MSIHSFLRLTLTTGLILISCRLFTPPTADTAAPVEIPTLAASPFDQDRTVYGFFPSPAEVTIESVLDIYQKIGAHAEVVLLQQEIPWKDLLKDPTAPSARITDIRNQYILAHQNNLDVIFVIDPLNGLDRREFYNLPFGWEASFGNPDVRAAMKNYALRIIREFHPLYLGLGSEINTYADTHPDDFPNYLSLYNEIYDAVKSESPATRVFVTFQWEELNNLIPGLPNAGEPYEPNWHQMETFEPRLDLWVISSYPFISFESGADIPEDYYSPLLARTQKPIAVAEGGWPTEKRGTPQDQVEYLQAVDSQLASRLEFWIYLILSDFNVDSYAKIMRFGGHGEDIETLRWFASVGLMDTSGTPKPALAIWDSICARPPE